MPLQRNLRIGLALVGLALLAVSGSKILHFESFLDSLDAYLVLPDVLLEPVGIVLVGAELAVALGLCIPRFQRTAALGSIGLILLFAVAIGSSLSNGMSIDCGCFGALSGPTQISWLMVWRNLAIALTLALALAVISPAGKEWTLRTIKTFLASHFRTVFTGAVMAVMASSLIWLIQNNHILSLKLEAYTPSKQPLMPRDDVPPLRAKRVGGDEEEVRFTGDQKMVLIIFSPQCIHCQQAIEFWNGEIERNRAGNNPIKVVGVSVLREVSKDFMDRFHVAFPIYIPDNMRQFRKTFPARSVPMTLFINPDGKVALSFQGYPPRQTGL